MNALDAVALALNTIALVCAAFAIRDAIWVRRVSREMRGRRKTIRKDGAA